MRSAIQARSSCTLICARPWCRENGKHPFAGNNMWQVATDSEDPAGKGPNFGAGPRGAEMGPA
eukprot:10180568-Alexandrium_andersonii.AAC.1